MPDFACTNNTSEDCLYANVYVPRRSAESNSPLPVVLFLYGGNFYEGGIEGQLYDGRVFANRTNSIFVVINYRLGVLGFMAGGSKSTTTTVTSIDNGRETTTTTTALEFEGNYGLQDQLQAMKWVQQNAASFGGDPAAVTLWGQVRIHSHSVPPAQTELWWALTISSEPRRRPC